MKEALSFPTAALLVGACLIGSSVPLTAQDAPPNIIFFLSDDHRADFLSCAGHPILKTPVLDRLAAQGTRFENAFVTTSICAASRASILTGLHERTHKFTFGTPPISKAHTQESYPAMLRKAGYKTGFVGKFGVGVEKGEREVMFDFFKPLNRSPYFKKQADGTLRHVTEIAGDEAIAFLKKQSKERPFCLSVSFNAAHAEDGDKKNHFPWPKAEDGLYNDVTIPAPRYSSPDVFANHPEFLKKSMNRDRWFWRWDTPEKYQHNVKAYYRMITGFDRVIGRVLDELITLGMADNTVIIFNGDNGYYKGARGFAGKWSHYEESLRVPLIIFDPRQNSSRGRVNALHVLNIDIPATILDYAGLPKSTLYQGISLKPLVAGHQPSSWRTESFHEHLMDNASIPKWEGIRGQRYVYARYFQQEPPFEFLHDLEKDPGQLTNYASDPNYAEALADMRQRCLKTRDQLGGEYSLENIPTKRYLKQKSSQPSNK